MSLLPLIDNLLNPPVLFFFLGVLATLLKSDLEIPTPIARFLSLYLLFAIGFHGGVELRGAGLSAEAVGLLAAAAVFSVLAPLWVFRLLRRTLKTPDAAALAACYGSVSAVTFVTAVAFLRTAEVPFDGYMVAALALMESPAIITGVLLYRRHTASAAAPLRIADLGREAFLNGAVFLLMGSLLIGFLTGERGWESLKPFLDDPFKGLLCLFLLDMGLVAARKLRDLREAGGRLVLFALAAPLVHGALGIAVAYAVGAGAGNALLLAVLFASASYIAVPAAMRMAIPKSNPSVYLPMSLGVTFPFNVAVGIPLFFVLIGWLWE